MDRNPKPWFQGVYLFMGTLNCPNQYKIPGGCAFDDLFDAWTLVTTIVGGVLLSDSKENM